MKNLLIFFSGTNAIVNYLVWSFFSILVYKVTGNLADIFLTMSLLNVGGLVGFILGSIALQHFKLNTVLVISSLIQGLLILIMAFSINFFGILFGLFSIVRGIATGMALSVSQVFLLKDIHKSLRPGLINSIQSLTLILGLFVPTIAGFLLEMQGGYTLAFVIGSFSSLLYLFSGLQTTQNSSKLHISTQSMRKVLKKANIPKSITVRSIEQGALEVFISCMTIVPFLILGSESGVGLLKSLAVFFTAVTLLAVRNSSLRKRFGLGAIGGLFQLIGQIVLVVTWTVPGLIIRQIMQEIFSPFRTTVNADMSLEIDEAILGDDLHSYALSITFINQILSYIAKIIVTILGFLALVYVSDSNSLGLIQFMILLSSFVLFSSTFAYRLLLNKVSKS